MVSFLAMVNSIKHKIRHAIRNQNVKRSSDNSTNNKIAEQVVIILKEKATNGWLHLRDPKSVYSFCGVEHSDFYSNIKSEGRFSGTCLDFVQILRDQISP